VLFFTLELVAMNITGLNSFNMNPKQRVVVVLAPQAPAFSGKIETGKGGDSTSATGGKKGRTTQLPKFSGKVETRSISEIMGGKRRTADQNALSFGATEHPTGDGSKVKKRMPEPPKFSGKVKTGEGKDSNGDGRIVKRRIPEQPKFSGGKRQTGQGGDSTGKSGGGKT